ncbi:MAG: hypothetical protein M3116_05915, partial [Actinomycetota bacterium]|nr:hypothetical protein [Actinomycetota bacterium]
HDGDRLTNVQHTRLEFDAQHDSTATFSGRVRLERAGSFGYNVRVVPNHSLLATPAELGVIAVA